MGHRIEPDDRAEASGCIVDALAAQLVELDRVFHRTVQEAATGTVRHRHEMRLALKAQAQCRTTLRLLLALRCERQAKKKSPILRKRTIENGNTGT